MTTSLFLPKQANSQSQNEMSYQSIIRDSSNALVANSVVGIRISILQTSSSGAAVYIETQTPTTNANGMANISIGGGIVLSGNYTNINWANGPYFIKTETDPLGGTNYTIIGTSQLMSVPYALYAANSGSISVGGNFTHFIGEHFGGGVIFHLWKDTLGIEHGLIIDKRDLSHGQVWSNNTTILIGPTSQSIWDGLSNSNAIVGQAGHTNSAADLCLGSTNGLQSDWYLPSIQELNMLRKNYYLVDRSLSQITGATRLAFNYWSSTEYSAGRALSLADVYGADFMIFSSDKNDPLFVRAIRAF